MKLNCFGSPKTNPRIRSCPGEAVSFYELSGTASPFFFEEGSILTDALTNT